MTYVRPAACEGERGAQPVEIGYPLIDATIGGLRPGGVTVIVAFGARTGDPARTGDAGRRR